MSHLLPLLRAGHARITSQLSIGARPELGRVSDTPQVRLIRWLSSHRILLGTAETAGWAAVMAATSPAATPEVLFGPGGAGQLGGAPAEHRLFPPLLSHDDAGRVWDISEELTRTRLPTS